VNNHSILLASPSPFPSQPDNTQSLNLPGNRLEDTNTCGSQSSSAYSGSVDSSKGANDVDTTHAAPLDIPRLLDDSSPPTTVVSDINIPSSNVEDLWQ